MHTLHVNKLEYVIYQFSVAEWLNWWVTLGVMPPLSDWEVVGLNPTAGEHLCFPPQVITISPLKEVTEFIMLSIMIVKSK